VNDWAIFDEWARIDSPWLFKPREAEDDTEKTLSKLALPPDDRQKKKALDALASKCDGLYRHLLTVDLPDALATRLILQNLKLLPRQLRGLKWGKLND
jgi:hypothetical protein